MITPSDILRPNTRSGYSKVAFDPDGSSIAPYRANAGKKNAGTPTWYGPRRATAREAAQDYCDYMNKNAASTAPKLKSAGHKIETHTRKPRTPLAAGRAAEMRRLRKKLRELAVAIQAEAAGDKGYVYLIGEVPAPDALARMMVHNNMQFDGAAVKIGYASKSVYQRIRDMQTGNPRQLVILGYKPGYRDDEQALHAQFIHHNILGEWFCPTPAILSTFPAKED